ncbi:basic helix-loop-helix (bHLH) DNA-binding superfamily protein [Euphorbia peplus]|nr:basic helix-loop-helix (bHLH) DNA-binding superfamily protein [Euphorbia peplus]
MDPWKQTNNFSHSFTLPADLPPSNPIPDTRQKHEVEAKDPVAARKVQKADREKLRRDRLNEQFLELGKTLEPDRPKNDKATILVDTIQVLKDLTAEVNKLKAEYATLSEESHELMQEKNELREEKASLKSDIESLNVQYQQRMRVMFPWGAVDPSVVMGPTYPYPVPVPVPPGSIAMHPSMQPFPFFGSQNPGAIPGACSTFIPYATPANPPNEQQPIQYASSSHVSSRQDSISESADQRRGSSSEKCHDSNDVATELELKMPGSSAQRDTLTGERKGKKMHRKEKDITSGSSSSQYTSHAVQDSSSNSVGDAPRPNV